MSDYFTTYKGYRDTTLIVWKERADRIYSQQKKKMYIIGFL